MHQLHHCIMYQYPVPLQHLPAKEQFHAKTIIPKTPIRSPLTSCRETTANEKIQTVQAKIPAATNK